MDEPSPELTPELTMRERMLAGEPYLADDPELSAAALRAQQLIGAYNATGPDDVTERRGLLLELCGSLGDDVTIRPPFQVDYGTQIHVGDHVFANFGLIALDCGEIRIGSHTQFGPNVQLLTPTHPLDAEERRAGWEGAKPITIGDNVWIGGGAIICPGVTIGDNAVIGAGAVVTRDIPADVVAVGNPARVSRQLR